MTDFDGPASESRTTEESLELHAHRAALARKWHRWTTAVLVVTAATYLATALTLPFGPWQAAGAFVTFAAALAWMGTTVWVLAVKRPVKQNVTGDNTVS